MDLRGYQQYKEQSINTMTQSELLLLLYDELVKRITRAEISLKAEQYPLFEASVERCIDIIHYFDDTLDPQFPISRDLHRLYEYFCFELCRINAGRNMTELLRIKPMLIDLRDSFRTAAKTSGPEK